MEGSQHSTDCDQKSDVKTCWQDEAFTEDERWLCDDYSGLDGTGGTRGDGDP